MKFFLFVLMLFPGFVYSQINLLQNPSMEPDWSNNHYPRDFSLYDSLRPYFWEPFNNDPNDGQARWYCDSIWNHLTSQTPNPQIQNGYYNAGVFQSAYPYQIASSNDTNTVLLAADGSGFSGFDAKASDWTKEGVQQRFSDCPLNSGDYEAGFQWSRAYQESNEVNVDVHLGSSRNQKDFKIGTLTVGNGSYVSGQWAQYSQGFNLQLQDAGKQLDWFMLSGRGYWVGEPSRYIFVDDFSLHRPCDEDSICYVPTGQICPQIAIQSPPANPFSVSNIQNANSLRIEVYASNGSSIYDVTHHNPNGMPDWYLPASFLGQNVASGTYGYKLTLSNKCGGLEKAGKFTVLSGIYSNNDPWVDSTATWSEVPVACCLNTLTLRNTEIRGNLDYIVKDTIWVEDGVTVANGSDVLIQAGQVVELDSVEFDGTNATVEILEAPCQSCRLASPESRGGPIGTSSMGNNTNASIETALSKTTDSNFGSILESTPSNTSIKVFPNPFEDQIDLSIQLAESGQVTTEVSNQLGQIIYRSTSVEIERNEEVTIQVDSKSFPPGIYLLRVTSGNWTTVQRIVKQ